MRFALIDNVRKEAGQGLHGLCPRCSQPVIAKCGEQRIWHWAHRNNKMCDKWWESETQWHRSWKNNYPFDWQEVVLVEESTGYKHIADVKTIHNLIIEFQYSHIDPKERAIREMFYKNMIWVVNGTRLKRDFPRFCKAFGSFRMAKQRGFYFVDFIEDVFSKDWLNSTVPVIFDFRDISKTAQQDRRRDTLWCLAPQRGKNSAVVVAILPEAFIEITNKSGQLFQVENQVPQQKVQSPKSKKIRRDSQFIFEQGRWKRRERF